MNDIQKYVTIRDLIIKAQGVGFIVEVDPRQNDNIRLFRQKYDQKHPKLFYQASNIDQLYAYLQGWNECKYYDSK